jgi:threonine synthase
MIFTDNAVKEKLAKNGKMFSSANSINWGRLAPQIIYYVSAYVELAKRGDIAFGDTVNVVVPTGNFGNILAAYYAKNMGVPIGKLICASNVNKVLTDFIETGVYDRNRDFFATCSPSMDILISSNLERLLFMLNGRDSDQLNEWMYSLEALGFYTVLDSESFMEGMKVFWGGYCVEEDTLKAIGDMWKDHGYLMDTHTAVAYKVYKDYVAETGDETPAVLASTASAFKFAEAVGSALGLPKAENGFRAVEALEEATGVSVPYGLKDLDKKEVKHTGVVTIEEMPGVVLEVK